MHSHHVVGPHLNHWLPRQTNKMMEGADSSLSRLWDSRFLYVLELRAPYQQLPNLSGLQPGLGVTALGPLTLRLNYHWLPWLLDNRSQLAWVLFPCFCCFSTVKVLYFGLACPHPTRCFIGVRSTGKQEKH